MNVWFGVQEYAQTQYIQSLQKPLIALRNSLVVSCTATFLAVAFGAVIAYGVSRYRILSDARMFQLLMLRMIPPIVAGGAALALLLRARPARQHARTDPDLLHHQPALRGVDDQELHRRSAARDRAGGGIARRVALARHFRGRAAADPLRPGRDLPVHPHPDLERVSARLHHRQDRGRHAAGRAVEVPGHVGRPGLRPPSGSRGRHHDPADDRRPSDPPPSRARLQFRHGAGDSRGPHRAAQPAQGVRIGRRGQRTSA